jgi:DNA-directed RNA polymerase subunit H (RpoH/RPB5)
MVVLQDWVEVMHQVEDRVLVPRVQLVEQEEREQLLTLLELLD